MDIDNKKNIDDLTEEDVHIDDFAIIAKDVKEKGHPEE